MAAYVKVIEKDTQTSVDLKAQVFQRAIAVHSPRPAVRHAASVALAPLAQRLVRLPALHSLYPVETLESVVVAVVVVEG